MNAELALPGVRVMQTSWHSGQGALSRRVGMRGVIVGASPARARVVFDTEPGLITKVGFEQLSPERICISCHERGCPEGAAYCCDGCALSPGHHSVCPKP